MALNWLERSFIIQTGDYTIMGKMKRNVGIVAFVFLAIAMVVYIFNKNVSNKYDLSQK
jgi:cbb3-type cytochrome oxidase subunit 3